MERPHRVDRGVAGGGGVRVGHGALRLLRCERRRERREDNRRGRAHLDMIHGSSFVFSARRSAPLSSRRAPRSEEHTSELQSPCNLVCRLLLEKKKNTVSLHMISACDT